MDSVVRDVDGGWAAFGLAAALVGIGGTRYLLPPASEMTALDPPPPAPRPAPPVLLSRISLPGSIPLTAIADRLNRGVPRVFRGRERDPVRTAPLSPGPTCVRR